MTSIGFMGPAIALLGMSFVGCNPFLAVILLCLGVMLDGVGYAGTYIIYFLLKCLNISFFCQAYAFGNGKFHISI